MNNTKHTLNILKYLVENIENGNIEVRDLGYKFNADTIEQAHPAKPWVVRRFYDGIRDIEININYKDLNIVKISNEKIMKFMSSENPEEFYE